MPMTKIQRQAWIDKGLCPCKGHPPLFPGLKHCSQCRERRNTMQNNKTLANRGLDTGDPLLIYRSRKGTLLKRPVRVGDKFGEWEILSLGEYTVDEEITFNCRCSCGETREVRQGNLLSGVSSSCGTGIHEGARNPDRENQAMLGCYYRVRNGGAKSRGIEWSLSLEQFEGLTRQNCFYCGIEPQTLIINWHNPSEKDWPKIYRNGIDRVDSAVGYVPENCVSCCSACNTAKMDRDFNEFLDWAKRLAIYQNFFDYTETEIIPTK